MQKTITINGKKYTGKQIAKMLDKDNMTNGNDYIVNINGDKFYANYRQVQDAYFSPTCQPSQANALVLMPDQSYTWEYIWLSL